MSGNDLEGSLPLFRVLFCLVAVDTNINDTAWTMCHYSLNALQGFVKGDNISEVVTDYFGGDIDPNEPLLNYAFFCFVSVFFFCACVSIFFVYVFF